MRQTSSPRPSLPSFPDPSGPRLPDPSSHPSSPSFSPRPDVPPLDGLPAAAATSRSWPRPLLSAVVRLEAGQATAEYALVLLGVAAVALAFVTWAGGGRVAAFLDGIFDRLVSSGS